MLLIEKSPLGEVQTIDFHKLETWETFSKGAVLLVDKPLGWTSFDVVNKIRWNFCQKLKVKKLKIGHAGTLDPLATGLLILCIGDFTKRIEQFQDLGKEYTGSIVFGATTASFDLEKAPDTFFPTEHLTDDLLKKTIEENFLGNILQIPPMFSAVKVDGKRLYKNARTGEEMELEPRPVFVKSFEISPLRPVPPGETAVISLNKKGAPIFLHPNFAAGKELDFKVSCGKGTYIRSLAKDLGEMVGSGAYLSLLRRTKIGNFSSENAWQVDEFISKLMQETR